VGLASFKNRTRISLRTGRITVSWREGFRKIYDLTENLIPQDMRSDRPSFNDSVEWACQGALRALGFATAKEVSEFMNLQPSPKRGPGSRKGKNGHAARNQNPIGKRPTA
jgi:uncharacterized protein YcaQ